MAKKRIFIAGHNGMVGSSLVRKISASDNHQIIVASKKELDLTNQKAVIDFFSQKKIDQVYLAAAKVGGIHANNKYPAEFIYQNLMIEANIINAAHQNNIEKLLFLGSSCIYPKLGIQPLREESLLSGELECSNEPYAVAKIAGIKLCESYNRQYGRDYRSVMPTNLYGINDNFHLENSHVIPALIRRFHDAKIKNAPFVKVWGTGNAMREFLYVDEMADASIFVMNLDNTIYAQETQPMLSHINIGTGIDCSIKELSETIANIIGYEGKIKWDASKPDGTPRKVLDVSRLERLGWKSNISLKKGLTKTYSWFLENINSFRA
jgi:GDP-L-fucose synthase